MDVALIEDAEDDIHGHQGSDDEKRLGGKRRLERLKRARKHSANGLGHTNSLFHLDDGSRSVAKGHAGSKIERDGYGGILALVINGERRGIRLVAGYSAERNNGA